MDNIHKQYSVNYKNIKHKYMKDGDINNFDVFEKVMDQRSQK